MRLEDVLMVCREGIEIIYLPNRKGRLMKTLRSSNVPSTCLGNGLTYPPTMRPYQ